MGERPALIVLGNGIDQNGNLPPHVMAQLIRIAREEEHTALPIILSGKWSINYTRKGIAPGSTEAYLMAQVLLDNGISSERLLLDESSQDTIGNALHTREIVRRYGFTHILVEGWEHNAKRAEMIFSKAYEGISFAFHANPSPWEKEDALLFIEQEAFLSQILRDGINLSELYSQPYYQTYHKEFSLAAMGWEKEKVA